MEKLSWADKIEKKEVRNLQEKTDEQVICGDGGLGGCPKKDPQTPAPEPASDGLAQGQAGV